MTDPAPPGVGEYEHIKLVGDRLRTNASKSSVTLPVFDVYLHVRQLQVVQAKR